MRAALHAHAHAQGPDTIRASAAAAGTIRKEEEEEDAEGETKASDDDDDGKTVRAMMRCRISKEKSGSIRCGGHDAESGAADDAVPILEAAAAEQVAKAQAAARDAAAYVRRFVRGG